MSYYDNRAALVTIAMELESNGWKIFGFREDESDSMTDYYSPASWSVGLATKNGYVLVIDNHSNRRSGYEVKKYNYNKTSYKASDRIVKLEAMMNDPASTENEKASCAVLIEKEKEKQGIAPTYTVEEVYPTFAHGNPKAANWHVEKDGVILAKGNGAFAVNNYDWENKEVSREQQQTEKLAKFIAKIEKVLTDSDALKAEVVKVPVTVVKEVELNVTSVTDADIKEGFTFVYKVSYTQGNHKGTKYKYVEKHVGNNDSETVCVFAKLGKNNKPSKAFGNTIMPKLSKLNDMLGKGHIAIIEFQEVTEYVEKTVFTKTKRTQKASNAVQIESNEVVTEQPAEQPEQATETAQAETVTNDTATEEQATKRQLWALHCATKLNTTNLIISKQKASELITKSKAGHNILEEVKVMLNGKTVEESKPEQAQETQETVYNESELEAMTDNIIEYTANLMTDWETVTAKRPETAEEKEDFKNKLYEYMVKNNYPINAITDHVRTNYTNFIILLEALESLRASQTVNNSKQEKEQDQTQFIEKIDKQIESAQKKLDSLSGNHLTNTWKRQQEEASREMKRESLRYEIALLEYIKDKASNNSMTSFEQALLVGAFRDKIHSYSISRGEYSYPEIDSRYDLDGWYNKEVPKKQKRLQKAGLYNITQLTAAVEEYKAIKNEIQKPVSPIIKKIKKLESEVKFRKIIGYFPTPKTIVEKILNHADIRDGETILEPSAGNGNILDGITAYVQTNGITATIEAVEWNHSLREILELKNYKLVSNDFIEYAKYNHYDKIIMNPPFEKNQDIQHVQHAFKCLKDGGRLVAIMSPHFTFASDTASVNFREWLEGRGYFEKLPEGAFKESGTNVNTVMVVIDKLEETAAEAI